MITYPPSEPHVPDIRELYPNLSDAELAAADENLRRYAEIVLRICDHLDTHVDPGPTLTPLTPAGDGSTMESQRSIPNTQ